MEGYRSQDLEIMISQPAFNKLAGRIKLGEYLVQGKKDLPREDEISKAITSLGFYRQRYEGGFDDLIGDLKAQGLIVRFDRSYRGEILYITQEGPHDKNISCFLEEELSKAS